MTLYASDFKISTISVAEIFDNTQDRADDFSVIISKSYNNGDEIDSDSIINASKPIFYFASVIGLQIAKFSKNSVRKINMYNKLYSLCVMAVIITLLMVIKPISWKDTRADIPLNILTITFTMLHYAEVIFIIFCVPFLNGLYYIKMIRIFDDLFKLLKCNNKSTFIKLRTMSIIFSLIPTTQFICTFFLRKFYISNIGVHLTIFVILIQGSLIYFFVLAFYEGQKFFNRLLETKLPIKNETRKSRGPRRKQRQKYFLKKMFTSRVDIKPHHRCWLEFMQMYDKMADTVYIFNKIYSWQVLLMFTTWLVCTLLTLCRSLSPSLNYSEIYLSDLFIYTCINSRPFFLGVMCELIVNQWLKTRDILIHVMIQEDLDDAYFQQVQTMLDLVETRRLEISANVFLVNIPIVTNFAGRAISYAVLMIQYFYIYILK